mgnify:CR=1 FL=1
MAPWIRVEDKTTKEFFQSKGERHCRTVMCNLNLEDGVTTENGEEMRSIAIDYYKCLLNKSKMTTWEDTKYDIVL